MRADVENLLKQYGIKSFGNKKNLEIAGELIRPDEKLIFITPTNIKIRKLGTDQSVNVPGVVFISDKRVLFQQAFAYDTIYEFKLSEIHSVGAKSNGVTGGHISFCTEENRVDFLVTYKVEVAEQIRDTFIQAIAAADDIIPETTDAVPEAIPTEAPVKTAKVVECPGCGATNIVRINQVGKCEYCGSYIQ